MQVANPKAKKSTTVQFYDAIKKEYFRLCNVKKNGVRLYSEEYVLSEVASKYFRSPRTIENILYGRV